MDKVEQYLDRICRSIGGPRALRQHIRQELREHLRDAAAEYRRTGLSEEEALDRALADFGGPEEVRSELEAMHGHRLLPVLIDRAMEWKERTMRARWLWTTWAYLTVGAVVVVNVLFFGFSVNFLIPKLEKMKASGWLVNDSPDGPSLDRLFELLGYVQRAWEHIEWWFVLLLAGWGLFEWRVRSENKTLMRLGGLGTLGVGLTLATAVTGVLLALPFMIGLPPMGRAARHLSTAQVEHLDRSVARLEQARAKKEWETVVWTAEGASNELKTLSEFLQGIPGHPESSADALQTEIRVAQEALKEVQAAARAGDAAQVEAALQKFQKAYEPVRQVLKGKAQ